MANETLYFSHDSNAHDDPKSVRLIRKFGMEGWGTFWLINALLSKEEFRKLPCDDKSLSDIAYKHHIDEKYLIEFFAFCSSKDIFAPLEPLYQTDGKLFWSDRLIMSLEMMKQSNLSRSQFKKKWWADKKAEEEKNKSSESLSTHEEEELNSTSKEAVSDIHLHVIPEQIRIVDTLKPDDNGEEYFQIKEIFRDYFYPNRPELGRLQHGQFVSMYQMYGPDKLIFTIRECCDEGWTSFQMLKKRLEKKVQTKEEKYSSLNGAQKPVGNQNSSPAYKPVVRERDEPITPENAAETQRIINEVKQKIGMARSGDEVAVDATTDAIVEYLTASKKIPQ